MLITETILIAAATAAKTLCDGECVHVHADGSATTGTDGQTTRPARGWGSVAYTYHPGRADDAWDCFEAVEAL